MAEDRYLFCIWINRLQEDTIRHMFMHWDWELEVVEMQDIEPVDFPPLDNLQIDTDNVRGVDSNVPSIGDRPNQDDSDDENSDSMDGSSESSNAPASENDHEAIENDQPAADLPEDDVHAPEINLDPFPHQLIDPVGANGGVACADCLCTPCITHEDNRQLWWINNNKPPHRKNHSKRRGLYKRFWVMLGNRALWSHPIYLDRKARALGLDPQNNRLVYNAVGNHIRDIIPNCVIDKVRSWLPNLPGEQYMGHKWE
jgi:hypothetical protein